MHIPLACPYPSIFHGSGSILRGQSQSRPIPKAAQERPLLGYDNQSLNGDYWAHCGPARLAADRRG